MATTTAILKLTFASPVNHHLPQHTAWVVALGKTQAPQCAGKLTAATLTQAPWAWAPAASSWSPQGPPKSASRTSSHDGPSRWPHPAHGHHHEIQCYGKRVENLPVVADGPSDTEEGERAPWFWRWLEKFCVCCPCFFHSEAFLPREWSCSFHYLFFFLAQHITIFPEIFSWPRLKIKRWNQNLPLMSCATLGKLFI